MQAFALSTPLHLHPFHHPRLGSVSSRKPFFSSISRTRATLNQQDEPPLESALTPAMTATADVAQTTTPSISSARDNDRIAAVRSQMEFWFSPSNLRRDWFLRKQMDPDGWLDPSVFLLFNKIKSMHADINDIILACKTSDELEVSFPDASSFGDDIAQTRVRRSPELPSFTSDHDMELERSFIVSGLPEGCTIDALLAIFSNFAPVTYAHIYRNKNFPDSPRALICFADQQTATGVYNSFMSNVPVGCEGMKLRKRARPRDSDSEREEGRTVPSTLVCELNGLPTGWNWRTLYRQLASTFKNETNDRTNLKFLMYTAGSEHCHISVNGNEAVREYLDKLRMEGIAMGVNMVSVRLLEDDEELANYWRSAKEYESARKARKADKMRSMDLNPETLMQRNPVGVIVMVEGLPAEAKWRTLHGELGKMGDLVYLTRERNAPVCFARFGTAEEAREVVDLLMKEGGGTKLCGRFVEASILEGEKEIEYWRKVEEDVKRKQEMSRRSTSSFVTDEGQTTGGESEE